MLGGRVLWYRLMKSGSGGPSRFLSNPLIQRVPFSIYSALIRRPQTKKGKRVLLRNLVDRVLGFRV